MRTLVVPVIGQHLTEVDIVIRPDGIEVGLFLRIHKQTLVRAFRNRTVCIAVVTVCKAILYVAAVCINTVNTR